MTDDKKLTLGGRGTLGMNKGGEPGKVRQSFSHGRSKAVVVEHKKPRILRKPGEAVTPAVGTEAITIKKPIKTSDTQHVHDEDFDDHHLSLTEVEQRKLALLHAEEERRREQEADRRRREEEDRARAEEEARRNAEVAARSEEDDARLRAADDAKRKAAEEVKRKAEKEDAKKAEDSQRRTAELEKAARERETKLRAAEEEANKKKALAARKGAVKGGDDRRKGRLTVTQALGDDGEGRARSLAAYKRAQQKHKRQTFGGGAAAAPKQPKEIVVPEAITVQDLAQRMAEKATAVIRVLMKMGVMATINQILDQDTAELIVSEFGHTVKRVSDADVEEGIVGADDSVEELQGRPPVVTIMGHVDHGKTSLLDALRSTDVVAGEAGGITQHIGAYQVKLKSGQKITFIDTPGHAAFSEMRARGASVTDIVILVVAADDGIMPQTIEAINHAKAANVPMIVAINKIDKPAADADKVRQELLQHGIVVEAYSGDVQDVPVSAKARTGLDELTDAISLQAEILELKANPDRPGDGAVIEAKLDKGRGPVATVLVQRGTLKVGDIFVAGAEWGRIRAMVNDRGQQVKEAGPTVPVEVLGLQGTPLAGDHFIVVENETRAREISEYRQSERRKKALAQKPVSIESMFSALKEAQAVEFPVLIKGDVQGSVEAINSALDKLGTDEVRCKILHSGVGAITESDITLARASGAPVIGFNVRANAQARDMAERDGVPIQYFSVIYDLIDTVKAGMAGQLAPELREITLGTARVLQVFQAGRTGKAAGCLVTDGVIKKDARVRLLRDGIVTYEGKIENLRRFKDDVSEVRAGTECGVTFEQFADLKPDDHLEFFYIEEHARAL